MPETGREFMEKTKYKYAKPSDQMMGMESPPLDIPYEKGGMILDLPDPQGYVPRNNDLFNVIKNRRSRRTFSQDNVTQEELSYLLWATQKVRRIMPAGTYRNVPAAGARHAFETYILVNRVDGVKQGIYRYLAFTHQIAEYNMELGIGASIMNGCMGQKMVLQSALTFIWTAVVDRMKWRYGERGYRYLHIDAGHVCQNLYLAGESAGCGVCAIAAFDDDVMNHILELDGDNRFVIYIAVAGRKK